VTAVQFDSLKYARRLRDVGVPEPQADTQAELMAEAFGFYVDNLVTKEHLDLALEKQGAQIYARFAEQDARIDARFADVYRRFVEQDARIEARFADQEARVDALSADVSRRFVEQDARIDTRFAEQDARMDARFARQERTLAVHTWMLGVIVVTVLVPTLKGLAL